MEPNPGGQGDDVSRAELRLEEQALRNDWPIPPAVKRQILQRLIDYCDRECEEGATAKDRVIIAAARVLAQFAGLSLGQARLDLARELAETRLGSEQIDLADLVTDAEARADQLHPRNQTAIDGATGQLP